MENSGLPTEMRKPARMAVFRGIKTWPPGKPLWARQANSSYNPERRFSAAAHICSAN
jgi:hypothetical protein